MKVGPGPDKNVQYIAFEKKIKYPFVWLTSNQTTITQNFKMYVCYLHGLMSAFYLISQDFTINTHYQNRSMFTR